ncbi:MAG: signal peptidase I [Ruminococcus sp.]|nr:signal peptidase I [Ruminococcus sp.]
MATKKAESGKKVLKILRIIKNVLLAVILTIFALILVLTMVSRISGNAPSMFGYSIYRVTSGSMEPSLKVGDVILSKSCGASELKVGDVVTYMGRSEEFKGKLVTHRIVKAPFFDSGGQYIITKGDSNPSNDSPVNLDDVMGVMQTKLGFVSVIYDFFVTPWGLIGIILLIILAFSNEIVILIQSILGFKKDDEDSLEKIIERYQKEQQAALKEKSSTENIEPQKRKINHAESILNSKTLRKKR